MSNQVPKKSKSLSPKKKKSRSPKKEKSINSPLSPKKEKSRSPSRSPKKEKILDVNAELVLKDTILLLEIAQKYEKIDNLEDCLSYYLLTAQSLYNYINWGLQSSLKKAKSTEKKRTFNDSINLITFPRHGLLKILTIIETLRKKLISKQENYTGCLDITELEESEDKEVCDPIKEVKLFGNLDTFDTIIGNTVVKEDIRNSILAPYQMPLMFDIQRNFLLYGPPGTGKTMFARAAATELRKAVPGLEVLFFAPTADELKGKYVGETEKKITSYFRSAQCMAEMRIKELGENNHVFSIIFIDEIDSLARSRQNDPSGTNAIATNALLQMMDGFQALENVLVIGATNYPWSLDGAILSRFNAKIHIKLPDINTAHQQIKFNLVTYVDKALPSVKMQSICAIDSGSNTFKSKKPDKKSDWWKTEFDLLSPIFGVTSDELHSFVKQYLSGNKSTPAHSPSNIKDICNKVFVSSSSSAQQLDIFHKIELVEEQSSNQNDFLSKIEGMYACKETYKRLQSLFPNNIKETDGRSTLLTKKPITIQINDLEYILLHKWIENNSADADADVASETVSMFLEYTGKLSVYIPQNKQLFSNKTINYCLYKECMIQIKDSCTSKKMYIFMIGEINEKDDINNHHWFKNNIQLDEILAKHITTIYIFNTIDDYDLKRRDTSIGKNDLHYCSFHVKGIHLSTLYRDDLYLSSNKIYEEIAKILSTNPEKIKEPLTLQLNKNIQSKVEESDISGKCFSLALSMNYFKKTVDTALSNDVVNASETIENVKKLFKFEKTGDVEK